MRRERIRTKPISTLLLTAALLPAAAMGRPVVDGHCGADGDGPLSDIEAVIDYAPTHYSKTTVVGDALPRAVACWLLSRAWSEHPVAIEAFADEDGLVTVARLKALANDPRRAEIDRAGAQAVLDLLPLFDTASGEGRPDGKIGSTDALALATNSGLGAIRARSDAAVGFLAMMFKPDFAWADAMGSGTADGKIDREDLRAVARREGEWEGACMVREGADAILENFDLFDRTIRYGEGGDPRDGGISESELAARADYRALSPVRFDEALGVGFRHAMTRTGPRSWEIRYGERRPGDYASRPVNETRWLGWGEDNILTLTDARGNVAHTYLDVKGLTSPATQMMITEAARTLRIALDGPADRFDGRTHPKGPTNWYLSQLNVSFSNEQTGEELLDTPDMQIGGVEVPRRFVTTEGEFTVVQSEGRLILTGPDGRTASMPFAPPAPARETSLNGTALVRAIYLLKAQLASGG